MAQQQRQQRGGGGTAVVERPSVKIETFRTALLDHERDLTIALGKMMKPEKFIEIALTMIASMKDQTMRQRVLACTPESLTLAVLQSAQVGLRVDGRQSTVVPYNMDGVQVAQWTPMVKGRIDLILRVPTVLKVVPRHVLSCDEFDVLMGTEERIVHRPNLDPPDDATLTHSYAVITLKDGTTVFDVLPKSRIEVIKAKFVKRPQGKPDTWLPPSWANSEAQMWEKCALNRVERLIDTDPDVARAIKLAVEAEFELPDADEERGKARAEATRGNIERQTAEISARVQQQKEQLEAQRAEERQRMYEEIKGVVRSQQLSDEEAVTEVRAALALAGFDAYPVETEGEREGNPALRLMSHEQLAAVLGHLRQLGPGFGGQTAGQGAPEGSEGRQEGQEAPQAPAAGAGAPAPAGPPLRMVAANSVNLRKIKRGKPAADGLIHVTDPDHRPKTKGGDAECIGCGGGMGPAAGAELAQATADFTKYCPHALVRLVEEYPDDRMSDELLEAVRAFEKTQSGE